MGFSLSWIAIRNKELGRVLAELGLRCTGKREEVPESPACGAMLPGNWCLIVANHFDFINDPLLARLSVSCEVVTCCVEEHVMFSAASQWTNGAKLWSVIHESEKGRQHLDATGQVPPQFLTVRNKLLAEQNEKDPDVDYVFDVPVELARELTGYRHDQGKENESYEILEPIPKRGNNFFRRLIGQ